MQEHLTEIELELARTGEAAEGTAAHLAGCGECRARMAEIEELAAQLGEPLEPAEIPAERDRVVIELAHERAAEIRRAAEQRPRRALRKLVWAVPLAAAAVLALVLVVPALTGQSDPAEQARPVAAGPDDVNRDGRVDILDAFALARAVESGRSDDALDANRDGKVDDADVERVSTAAVALAARGATR
jgi:hypothetical protein